MRAPAPSPRLALLLRLPEASAGLSALVAALLLVSVLLPVGFVLAVGALVGAIPQAARDGVGSAAEHRALLALATAGLLFLLQQALPAFLRTASEALADRATARLSERVMRAALAPTGIAHLEDPAMLDRIERARSFGPTDMGPLYAVPALVNVLAITGAGLAAALLLAGFAWWLPALVIAGHLVSRALARRQLFRTSALVSAQTRTLRRSAYFRDLAVAPEAAKELRVFGLASWAVGNFVSAWMAAMGDLRRRRGGGVRVLAGVVLPALLVDLAALALLAVAAGRGSISLAALVVYVQAVLGASALGALSTQDVYADQGARPVVAARELEEAIARSPELRGGADPDGLPRAEIRFERVRFAYPGQQREVLSGLDLRIPAGSSLAIVGANGAGKTTLVKLLARLYDPDAGRITADGVDLRELDPRAWQRRIAAIFQDFVRYQLPLADNVGLGAATGGDDPQLLAAAERAGLSAVVGKLPNGWDTVLDRRYSGGADLSGGEWQRVGIARALLAVARGAAVLVLDEPTANLDVRAEAELYDRFLELTRGLTTVLISHRFSTVRRADRICLLEDGRVAELGTHHELLASGGRYAELFRLQAAMYQRAEA